MSGMVSTILGGVGLFLLGMILLTEGLKALAGDSLRTFLARFTGGRFSAATAGALLTALVQSSSATTLATIGFVSAGLLSLQQAVGVILGANLGTTSTGWLVSVLGLKFSISKFALPLIGVGALAHLLTRERLAQLGLALAGFGLIFVGIDTLQTGMQSLSARIDPASFPSSSALGGRLLLLLLGALMTVVMQSSSAAMATTLTALHTETIDLTQAAALVVGQNVGTTVTAGLGAIGASSAAKRTALAHVLFNLLTGTLAFAVLVPAVQGLALAGKRVGVDSPALLLAAFHTGFNLVGVILFLPLLGPYTRFVTWLLPERGPRLTRNLGPLVARGPLALDAASLTAREILQEALSALRLLLAGEGPRSPALARLDRVESALLETRAFLGEVRTPVNSSGHERHLQLLHVLDHLDRLCSAAREEVPFGRVRDHADVQPALAILQRALERVLAALAGQEPLPHGALQEESQALAALRKGERPRLLRAAAAGELSPERAAEVLEAVRWIDRVGYHLWRAGHHLFTTDPASIEAASLPEDVEAGEAPEGSEERASVDPS
ncbi:MAG TPA: hypothetical protein DEA08_13770 [Planctomycetes bacterium]|mgnify:CR=1 FL=1|nr:hypothetical protein [Planctomycetota bacterium]